MSYGYKVNPLKLQAEGGIKAGMNDTSVKVIVGLDGYEYSHYRRDDRWNPTRGRNVHVSMNGPLQMTFDQLEDFADELKALVSEAREELEEL